MAMAAIKIVRNTPPLSNLTPTCQLTFYSPQPVVNEPPSTELEKFHASEFSTFTVQEAWDHGNIARLYQTLSSREEFKFLWPRLTCRECTFPHNKPFIQIGDEDYMASGNIARLYQTLSSREEFKFLWPRLTCRECTFPHNKPFIQFFFYHYATIKA